MKRMKLRTAAGMAGLMAGILWAAAPAFAIQFGSLRSFQDGPLGDSPQYAEFGKYEAEAAITFERDYGKYIVGGNTDSKLSASRAGSHVMAGGGMQPTKNFVASAFADINLANDYDEERGRLSPKVRLDSGFYQHEFGAICAFKSGGFMGGGGISIVHVGSEVRELEYASEKGKQEITGATMPILRAFAGFDDKAFGASAGFRLFGKGDATVTATSPGNPTKVEYDMVRRIPGEFHADGLIRVSKQLDLGAGLAYVLTGQASENVDEYSLEFATDPSGNKYRLTGERRNDNHVRFAFGARFQPIDLFALMGALQYTTAAYAKEEYASLEHRNLGGLRLDIGGAVKVQKHFRGFLHLGYDLEQDATFTVKDDRRDQNDAVRTQRAPLDQGSKVKLSQGSFEIVGGGGVVF